MSGYSRGTFLIFPKFLEYVCGTVAKTLMFPRDCSVSSLFADPSDATFTERLPSLLILCDNTFSCVTATMSFAIEFGFTFQNDDSGDVGLKMTGIPDGLFL